MIICSNEKEEKSLFISKLHPYRIFCVPHAVREYRKYLAVKFTTHGDATATSASIVDYEKYDIVINKPIFSSTCFKAFA